MPKKRTFLQDQRRKFGAGKRENGLILPGLVVNHNQCMMRVILPPCGFSRLINELISFCGILGAFFTLKSV